MYKPYTLKDVYDVEKTNGYRVFSCFAGMGGSSTGYRLSGYNIIGANEFMDVARKIYSTNYPTTKLFGQDIRKLTGKEICDTLGINIGELDILDGSPPCAAFSMQSITSRDKWGKEKKYSKTKQRVDDLFFEFARLLKELQPKVFVAENVKGLTVGKGTELLGSKSKRLTEFFDIEHERESVVDEEEDIINTLRNCGYNVSYRVLTASDYGVPQNRERLIFIGVRKDLNIKPSFPEKTVEKEDRMCGREVLEPFIFNGSPFSLKKDSKPYKLLTEYFKPNITRNEIAKLNRKYKLGAYESGFDRSNWFKPYCTVLQGGQKYHSIVDRHENLDEVKRIQTFPDDLNLLTAKHEIEYVSINDIKNGKTGYYESSGINSGDIDEIIKLSKISVSPDEKVFKLETNKISDGELTHKDAYEFIGRAVPPIMMKAISSHIKTNILDRIKNETLD